MRKIVILIYLSINCIVGVSQTNHDIISQLESALFPKISIDSGDITNCLTIVEQKRKHWQKYRPDDKKCIFYINKLQNCSFDYLKDDILNLRDRFIDTIEAKYTFLTEDSLLYRGDYEKHFILNPMNNLLEFYNFCKQDNIEEIIMKLILKEPKTNQAEKSFLINNAHKYTLKYFELFDTTNNTETKLNILNYLSFSIDEEICTKIKMRIPKIQSTSSMLYVRAINIICLCNTTDNAKFVYQELEKNKDSDFVCEILVAASKIDSLYTIPDICYKLQDLGNYFIIKGNNKAVKELLTLVITCKDEKVLSDYLIESYLNNIMKDEMITRLELLMSSTKDKKLKDDINSFLNQQNGSLE